MLSGFAGARRAEARGHPLGRRMNDIDDYLDENSDRFEQELCELLRIPSVSADSAHRDDVRQAAEWVADQFKPDEAADRTGPHRRPSDRLCRVAAGRRARRPCWSMATTTCSRPIRWTNGFRPLSSRPFATATSMPAAPPTTRGRCSRTSRAPRPGSRPRGKLPVQLKFLIEGEEEVGSQSLGTFIAENTRPAGLRRGRHQRHLPIRPGQPAITYGLRGIAYYELRLTGPKQDLHSGTFGGAVANPANALVTMLSALDQRSRAGPSAGLLRRRRAAHRTRARRVCQAAVRRSEFMQQIGVEALPGRRGLHDARTPLGPAHVRHQRSVERLSGRRSQDRAARSRRASSASAWCPIRTRQRSRPPRKTPARAVSARASRWN